MSFMKFHVFGIQKLVFCFLFRGFLFFFPFFFLLSTQFQELVALRKKLAQKHVSSKIFLAFLLCTSGTVVFSRHFLATVGMRKYWQKENGKYQLPLRRT